MKKWLSFATRLYPRNWREEYGKEFDALLDDVKPGWRTFVNVLAGGLRMQIANETNWLKLMGATAAIGAIVSGGIGYTIPPSYVSSATMRITPQPDPLRHTSPEALGQRGAQELKQMRSNVLSRQSLLSLINDPALDLYRKERREMPLEDVQEEMRRNIRIEALPSTGNEIAPMTFTVSFSYPDKSKVQATVRALANRFSEENGLLNRDQQQTYTQLWGDLYTAHRANPAPPPPTGDIVGILVPPSLPKNSSVSDRVAYLAWGLTTGLFVGLLAAVALRWPRRTWQLTAFAVSGCVLITAASFLIPNRYTATAVMEIQPARLTEDPLAPLPPVTPAREFLRRFEPQVLSPESLSMIIQRPWVNLYPEERAARPLEDVIRQMKANIRIAPSPDTTGAFSISFTYPDQRKVVDTVNALITAFIQEEAIRMRDDSGHMSATQREIISRRAGEYLDTLDPPITPQKPDSPDRLLIAIAGFAAGSLFGAWTLFFRRRDTSSLQSA